MPSLQEFKEKVQEIDDLLASYQPPRLDPDRIAGDILKERASQRPIFERAMRCATEALKAFPLHPAFLFRRALAKRMVVADDFAFPHAESAENDLRAALEVDPDNLKAGLELADLLFTFSAMDDAATAETAVELSEVAQGFLRNLHSLQIQALGYAGKLDKAESVYAKWSVVFPESDALREAIDDARSMNTAEDVS